MKLVNDYDTLIVRTIGKYLSENPKTRFGQFIDEYLKSGLSSDLNTEEPFSTYKNVTFM